MTFFDLISTRSYKMSGPSTKRYVFVKGKPVSVEIPSDISKFRCHTDIFFECDIDGAAIAAPENSNKIAKSFIKFNPTVANKLQDMVEKINEESKANAIKEREEINVDSILKEAEEDSNKNYSRQLKIIKKEKKVKNVLECELCGYESKDKTDLKDHLDKHSEED